ncbi:MAG TPA: hypothetical protein VF517_09530 [Thermoleophilaceae bacterium]
MAQHVRIGSARLMLLQHDDARKVGFSMRVHAEDAESHAAASTRDPRELRELGDAAYAAAESLEQLLDRGDS